MYTLTHRSKNKIGPNEKLNNMSILKSEDIVRHAVIPSHPIVRK